MALHPISLSGWVQILAAMHTPCPKCGYKIQPATEWLTSEEAGKYLKAKARTLLLCVRQGKMKAFALSKDAK